LLLLWLLLLIIIIIIIIIITNTITLTGGMRCLTPIERFITSRLSLNWQTNGARNQLTQFTVYWKNGLPWMIPPYVTQNYSNIFYIFFFHFCIFLNVLLLLIIIMLLLLLLDSNNSSTPPCRIPRFWVYRCYRLSTAVRGRRRRATRQASRGDGKLVSRPEPPSADEVKFFNGRYVFHVARGKYKSQEVHWG